MQQRVEESNYQTEQISGMKVNDQIADKKVGKVFTRSERRYRKKNGFITVVTQKSDI